MDVDRIETWTKEALLAALMSERKYRNCLEEQLEYLKAKLSDSMEINKRLSGFSATTQVPSAANSTECDKYKPKAVPSWIETLVISDSTYRKVDQRSIGKGHVSMHIHRRSWKI